MSKLRKTLGLIIVLIATYSMWLGAYYLRLQINSWAEAPVIFTILLLFIIGGALIGWD